MKFQLNIVLVRTLHSSNLGAAARVMSNMGASRLILVDPQCQVDMHTRFAAASAQKYIHNRTWYSNWDEFYAHEPAGLRIAFTPKDGKGRVVHWTEDSLSALKGHPIFEELSPTPVYLIFGSEDQGLMTEDLAFTHHNCALPTYGENPSLNLAQAVLLGLFLVRQSWGGEKTEIENSKTRKISDNKHFPADSLKEWIQTLGFQIGRGKTDAHTVLRRMMLHQAPTPQEVSVFEAVVQQTIRKLKELKKQKD